MLSSKHSVFSLRNSAFARAFRPLWIALVCGTFIMLRDYHVRHSVLVRLELGVTVEGQSPPEGFSVKVNGRDQALKEAVPVGFAEIVVSAPGTETWSTNRFIWYGTTKLGSVKLPWSRGSLVTKVEPEPDSYELVGSRGSWTNSTGDFKDIPIGLYRLTSRFGSFQEVADAQVHRNRTNELFVPARFGSLELTADPPEGEFELHSDRLKRYFTGTFPSQFRRLPAGQYRLIAKRPAYSRELPLVIRRNETNQFKVKFVYGSAEIQTTPPGATVYWGNQERGKTPLRLIDVVPGTYRFRVELEGFDYQTRELTVDSETPASVSLELVNSRYREAMEGAQRSFTQNEFGRAIQFLEAALSAKPGDERASGFLPAAKIGLHRARADVYVQRGEYESAFKELKLAEAISPADPEIRDVLGKVTKAKADADQRAEAAKVGQFAFEAKAATKQGLYDKAYQTLAEAKRQFPTHKEWDELETSFRREQEIKRGEAADALRRAEIDKRKQQGVADWERSVRGEQHAEKFATVTWQTSKSALDVLTALEDLAKTEASFKMSDLQVSTKFVFTVKIGQPSGSANTGRYQRLGVMTHDEGKTQILIKHFEFSGGMPVSDKTGMERNLDRFRTALAAKLGNDLK